MDLLPAMEKMEEAYDVFYEYGEVESCIGITGLSRPGFKMEKMVQDKLLTPWRLAWMLILISTPLR